MWADFLRRAIMQSIPLLYGSTGEILTEKSGNLNLGIPGIMYVGGIGGVIGAFIYEQNASSISPFLAVLIPVLCSMLCSLLMGLIYCFLTITLRANQDSLPSEEQRSGTLRPHQGRVETGRAHPGACPFVVCYGRYSGF